MVTLALGRPGRLVAQSLSGARTPQGHFLQPKGCECLGRRGELGIRSWAVGVCEPCGQEDTGSGQRLFRVDNIQRHLTVHLECVQLII